MSNEFEYEGPIGKFKAKGCGAVVLAVGGAVLLGGVGILCFTQYKEVMVSGLKLVAYNTKLLTA